MVGNERFEQFTKSVARVADRIAAMHPAEDVVAFLLERMR